MTDLRFVKMLLGLACGIVITLYVLAKHGLDFKSRHLLVWLVPAAFVSAVLQTLEGQE